MNFLRGGGDMRAIHIIYMMILLVISNSYTLNVCCQIENRLTGVHLALFDTVGQEKWVYRPFIKLAQSAGFCVDYIPIDKIMDVPLQKLRLHEYHAAIFIIGGEFFGGLQESHFCKKTFQVMQSFASYKNKLIGLALPAAQVNNPQATNVINAYSPFLSSLGLSIAPLNQTQKRSVAITNKNRFLHVPQMNMQSFLNTANLFLTTPVERRSLNYHTTLNPPHHGFVWDCDAVQNRLLKENSGVYLLPARRTCSKEIENTLPYGIYWRDNRTNNHIALFSPTVISSVGISESFHFCPINPVLKKEILMMTQRMLCELKMLMTTEHKQPAYMIDLLKKHIIPAPFPKKLQVLGSSIKTPQHHMRKTAWMEISAFYNEDMPAEFTAQQRKDALMQRNQQQDKLINYIIKAELDALWISITPNIYYSPIAKMVKKEDREKTKLLENKFLDSLSFFTKKLKQACVKSSCAIPKIIVGFEVANNLYGQNTPKNFGVDLFGNQYSDIPAPLEQSFWDQEVKIPLETFLEKWNDQRVSNGIPISGVMLDLEMYCRQKTGTFLTAMGFDAQTFNKFRGFKNKKLSTQTLHERVSYLMQQHLSEKYFQFLEKQATNLGTSLKDFFVKKIPDCQIMCYTPNILSNWFYKGLCKGLARGQDKPLYLLTFNSEFGLHQRWFEKNDIPVSHAQVLLLSKLQKVEDYKQVEEILRTHHGVWYNRFSRLAEQYNPNSWTGVEQSPMNEQETMQFFTHVRNLKK